MTPIAPTAVVTSGGPGVVSLTWAPNDPSDQVQHYVIRYASADWAADSWTASLPQAEIETGVSCCAFEVTPLSDETRYWFSVSAANGNGEGGESIHASAKPPGWRGSRQIGTSGADVPFSLAVSGADFLIATQVDGAFPGQSPNGGVDLATLRFDGRGDLKWARQRGGSNFDTVRGITSAPDGTVFATGFTSSTFDGETLNTGSFDLVVLKWNAAGTHQWTRIIGQAVGEDSGTGIIALGTDAIFLTGRTQGGFDGNTNLGGHDGIFVRYDANGNKIWSRQFGSPAGDTPNAIAADASGNLYMSGQTNAAFEGNAFIGVGDAFLIKYDSNGVKQWSRQFGTTADDGATGVAIHPTTGAIYVVGSTLGTLAGQTAAGLNDVALWKFTSSGTIDWVRQVGSSANDSGTAVRVRGSDVYLSGYTSGSLPGAAALGGTDGFVMRFSDTGVKDWTLQTGTPQADYVLDIALTSGGAILGAGISQGDFAAPNLGPPGTEDIFILKVNSDGTIETP